MHSGLWGIYNESFKLRTWVYSGLWGIYNEPFKFLWVSVSIGRHAKLPRINKTYQKSQLMLDLTKIISKARWVIIICRHFAFIKGKKNRKQKTYTKTRGAKPKNNSAQQWKFYLWNTLHMSCLSFRNSYLVKQARPLLQNLHIIVNYTSLQWSG